MKFQRICLVCIKLSLCISILFPFSAFAHLISITATIPFSSSVHVSSITTATFTVTNISSKVSLTAVDQSHFSSGSGLSILSSTCGAPLGPGQSCNIVVQLQAPSRPQTIFAELNEWAKPSLDHLCFPFTISVIGPQQFTVGGSVSGLRSGNLVLQNNGDDNLVISVNGAFTFSQPVSIGNIYNVTVLSQPPGQICTVSNGTGTITTSNITNVSVFCSDEFAYVANYVSNSGTVSLCTTSSSTGELTCSGTTGNGFTGASAVAINQARTFAYVVNFDGNTVSLCNINQTTGELTCPGTTGSGFDGPTAITINPTGTFAYISNGNGNSVSKCSVTPNTGELINCATTGGIFNFPEYIAINPQNTFAYVAQGSSINLCVIMQNTGELINCAQTGPVMVPFGIDINPAGTLVYVTSFFDNSVSLCSINQGTGELINCVPTGGVFDGPGGITINSANTFAYVSNYNGGTVSLCSIEPTTGALTCPGTTGGVFTNPAAVAF